MQVAGFLVSTNRCQRALFASGLVALITSSATAQTADPRSDFLNALGQFSLALDGTYGDEGQRLSTALDSMSAALSQWDALIQSRERAMAAEIGSADPKLASRMHLALGGLYLDRLRVGDALREFAVARSSDPSRPEVPLLQALVHDERPRVALAAALLEAEQFSEAEQTLVDTLKVLPASGRAHYLLGLTYQRQGNRVEALRELQSALTHRPLLGANTIHAMVGTLQKDEQDLDAAAKSFTSRVDLVPNDPVAHRELGRVYFLQGDDVTARAEFEVALLLNRSDVEAYAALGQLDLREGRYADAANVTRQALEIDPGHREARYVHATALIRMGNADEGAAEMQVFQRLQAEDSEARARQFELGRLRREASVARAAGDTANAVTLLRRALVYEPRSATSHFDLGLALLESGQTAEAIERLKREAIRRTGRAR